MASTVCAQWMPVSMPTVCDTTCAGVDDSYIKRDATASPATVDTGNPVTAPGTVPPTGIPIAGSSIDIDGSSRPTLCIKAG
eukprot:CAMPEP_0114233672 /NCGR_PEP_ID=MMETSP0058-20121206/5301_1 /TAXON_ID=36894 /ORGANISM="Pyramimonas parkeae, CCMP726" /LENGTH=80 /DNA_ID=CAMNT_0001345301 /DNA_START=2177 /DNA_END=2419 /DNA_ORIENTATION=-